MRSVDVNLVSTLCSLLTSFLIDEEVLAKLKADPPEEAIVLINLLFVFCYAWSIAGNADQESQDAFDGFMRECFEGVVTIPGAVVTRIIEVL